jgi:chromosome segregation protein
MRLSKIKLAGFKSFVEPTTISFPSNRTGIIGPNGCGKSNVIDAVRWVMGESSAKQLRGDSMDDVIFNGSSSRPPVSRASVDLIFDNDDHSLGGQYANYNEISLRREVTREGQSNYYLNGTRCRRRDIADIFLGTGLGPRSYAIIEQGMISRIIEAKPEELRTYLEEAAGITKYKERRRETETRIRHTRENLERLDDLRDEIEKQINHLKRQADAAERYKQLKNEERRVKAEWLALRWKTLDEKQQQNNHVLQEQQTKVEAVIAEQRAVELAIEQNREKQTDANEHLNTVQAGFYRLGSDISRIEQTIQHNKETRARQTQDLEKINQSWRELQQHVEDDRAKLQDVNQTIADKQPLLESLRETQRHSALRLAEAEQAMLAWQQESDEFNRTDAEATQAVQVEQTRLEQLAAHLARMQQRLERLADEQRNLSGDELESGREDLLKTESRQAGELEEQQHALQDSVQAVQSGREQIESLNKTLDEVRGNIQNLRGKLASLEALQQAALGKDKQSVVKWLEQRGLANKPRLAEMLQVSSGWELAVETVLNGCLEAITVDGLDVFTTVIGELSEGSVMLIDASRAQARSGGAGEPLSEKVKADVDVQNLLAGIYTADSLQQALAMRGKLAAGESVITAEGIWIGSNWLRITRQEQTQGGVLAREQEIKQSRRQLDEFQEQARNLTAELETAKSTLQHQEQRRETLQRRLQELNNQHAETRGQLNALNLQLEQLRKRREEVGAEIQEINQQLQEDREAQTRSQEKLQQAQRQVEQNASVRERLLSRREVLSAELLEAREHAQADKDALHEIALNLESMRSMQDSTDKNLLRMQQQLDHLQARRDELQAALAEGELPVSELKEELEKLLKERIEVDKSLGEARTQVEIVENEIRRMESQRSAHENHVQELRAQLEENRLAAQEVRVRCQTLKEQLDETGFEQELLFREMPQDAAVDAWAEKVEKLDQRIQRMGPINLAAIDEHKEQSERKEYLDRQHADLTEALTTLENAITKIDRETRSRFKEIFDKVNTSIRETFPRLFGGGQAHLEMTGDDLLSTGITIMARPPGKRISNIHLLSGGEKALTAVAMVFAIFQLNPAPFCMLDEVDAPLDEANVGRYSELVKEMSEKVQFIVITHNKTTMEMMGQLTGVTMREAGVSRIVAVDVDEAYKMATA